MIHECPFTNHHSELRLRPDWEYSLSGAKLSSKLLSQRGFLLKIDPGTFIQYFYFSNKLRYLYYVSFLYPVKCVNKKILVTSPMIFNKIGRMWQKRTKSSIRSDLHSFFIKLCLQKKLGFFNFSFSYSLSTLMFLFCSINLSMQWNIALEHFVF